jgi:hypothetical protein
MQRQLLARARARGRPPMKGDTLAREEAYCSGTQVRASTWTCPKMWHFEAPGPKMRSNLLGTDTVTENSTG